MKKKRQVCENQIRSRDQVTYWEGIAKNRSTRLSPKM